MSIETHANPAERRKEPRLSTRRQVNLRVAGIPSNVPSQLVDVSNNGFRARHGIYTLASGHIVEFAYGNVEGRARVSWTRIAGDSVESGFQVLPNEDSDHT